MKTEFKVWKTIKVGGVLKAADDFRNALKKSNINVSEWVSEVLDRSSAEASLEEQEIDLVIVSPRKDFGTDRFEDVCRRAESLGLEMCSREIGPQLRLQYLDQPKGERVLIAMRPIYGARMDPDPGIFTIDSSEYGKELFLGSYGTGHGGNLYCQEIVFVRPRTKKVAKKSPHS